MKIKQLIVSILMLAGTSWAGPTEDAALSAYERKDYKAFAYLRRAAWLLQQAPLSTG